jgi:hypothetical protein
LQGIYFPESLGLRTRTIGQIFKTALGASRVVAVYGAQAAGSTWAVSTALDYLKNRFGTSGIDAVAIAPYFAVIPTPEQVRTYTSMSMDDFFTFVRSNVLPSATAPVARYQTIAASYGIHLITYEGGQHMVGGSGAQADPGLNAMFFAFNRDPRMKQLYLDYLAACRQAGGELFMHYYDVGKFTQWGSWGALEYVDQPRALAPKFDALQTFIEQNPVWWAQ